MTIKVILRGGLGNQLHQYAAGFVLAHELGRRLLLDWSDARHSHDGVGLHGLEGLRGEIYPPMSLRAFPKFARLAAMNLMLRKSEPDESPHTLVTESDFRSFLADSADPIILDGYFQSWEHAETARTYGAFQTLQVRDQSRAYLSLLSEIRSRDAVCLHVRRGDMASHPSWGLLDHRYYDAALQALGECERMHEVWCFSDEPSWVLDTFPKKMTRSWRFVRGFNRSPAAQTLGLMSAFPAVITANSTLSWWAAMLGDARRVVVPSPWYRTGEDAFDRFSSEWIQVRATWE